MAKVYLNAPSSQAMTSVSSGAASGYGAKGDGVTDDAPALQSMMTACGNSAALLGAGIAYVPKGTYLMGATVSHPSNVQLWIDPGAKFVRKAGFTGNLFQNASASAAATRFVADAAITAGQAVLTSSSAAFTGADVNKTVAVWRAGPNRAPLIAKILSFTNSTTVTLDTSATYTVSGQACSIGSRDTNIEMRGRALIDGGDNSGATGTNQHHVRYRHVDSLRLFGFSMTSIGGKYHVSVADCTDLDFSDLTFNSNVAGGDGIHLDGPIINGTIQRISGQTRDDCIGVSPIDWSPWNDTQGDITGLSIHTIYASSVIGHVVALYPSSAASGYVVQRIHVDRIFGASANAGGSTVGCGDNQNNANTTGGYMDDIHFTNIRPPQWATGAAVIIAPSNGGRFTVDGVTVSSTGQSFGAVWCQAQTTPVNIESLEISNITVDGTGVNSSVILTTGTIASLTIDGVQGTWNGDVFGHSGTVSRLVMNNIVGRSSSNGGSLINNSSGSATLPRVELSNIEIDNQAWFLALSTTTEVHATNVTTTNPGNGLLYLNGANVTLRGANLNFASSGIVTAGSPTIKVRSFAWPIDLSIASITRTNGDMAYNTNGALACGLGPAVSNGTSWKGLYSGATY